MPVYSALLKDQEIMDLLATEFATEFRLGASLSHDEVALERVTTSTRRRCRMEGCTNVVVSKGRCIRHGGGGRCRVEGCDTTAKRGGLCWKHGRSQSAALVIYFSRRFSSLSARGVYELDQISRKMLDTRRRQAMRFRGLRTNSSSRWSLLGSWRWQAMQSQWMPAPSL
ncbi:hypothetical protein Ae201684_018921 [Aphanomyces euteiches]|uniref:WRKY19-like zinc finger domain-containing protein n=1 Tax=Aphanomyces euteiches TaxID=100861 RepID=A0A6G0W4W8_9STRA|nr:hypothetical protein Ae201684_018921 [Aphanomyces euteiches]